MMRSKRRANHLVSPSSRPLYAVLAALVFSVIPVITQARADTFATVNGARIWYQIRGRGEPVVVIPGGPGSSHVYLTPWLDGLSKVQELVYFDAFGRGKSSRARKREEYSLQRDVDDLEGLREALGFAQWSVLGHSYGGVVAQAYALQHPDSVAKLVLVDTLYDTEMCQANNDNSNYEFRNQFPERWEKLMAIRRQGGISISPEHMKAYDIPRELLFFFDSSNVSKRRSDAFNTDVYYQMVGDDGDFAIGGDLGRFDFKGDLKTLKMPVLIIAGRYDRISIPRFAVRYKDYAPQAAFVMFEKSGHYPFIEEQAKFMEVLLRFLMGAK
jgi:proline iminopeptidase